MMMVQIVVVVVTVVLCRVDVVVVMDVVVDVVSAPQVVKVMIADSNWLLTSARSCSALARALASASGSAHTAQFHPLGLGFCSGFGFARMHTAIRGNIPPERSQAGRSRRWHIGRLAGAAPVC